MKTQLASHAPHDSTAHIVFKPLDLASRRAAGVMETFDEQRHMVLSEVGHELLSMMPVVDQHEDDIQQMAAMLTRDVREAFGHVGDDQSILLRLAYQNGTTRISDIADSAARIVVIPLHSDRSLHARPYVRSHSPV